jgi:hypothetical protein
VTSEREKGKMKSLINVRFVIAVLTVACLMTVLLTVAPIRSGIPGSGEYDPWLDWNDDGDIDIKDVSRVAKAFGTNGQNISKAGIEYDSGWVDISGMAGQNITITHGLNVTDWNDENIDVSITGKASMGGELKRYVGLTGQIQGWNRTYGGTSQDRAEALVQTSDGGYALAGYTASFGAGSYDYWLVKTDASGTMQWNKTYGGTINEWAYALVQTTDGGYALAGETRSFGASNYNYWLVKTDASGNMQWNQTYGGTSDDRANALVQTTDDGYALAGYTASFGAGLFDFWLVKTDSSGNMQWNKTYGGTNHDYALDLVQTTDDGYALAGYTYSFGAGNLDCWLVRTDANGNIQWNQTYGGTSADYANALVQTSDGGYAIAGFTASFGAGIWDYWLVKTDASGTMQWNKTYGGTNHDYAYALVQTTDDGYALAGTTSSFGAGSSDFWLVKTDASGTMQWNQMYGGTNSDYAKALVQTSDGGYAIAGGILSFGAGDYDYWLVKTDASGNFGGVESGLAWVDSSSNTVTLYRGVTDANWNYVRIRLWKPR